MRQKDVKWIKMQTTREAETNTGRTDTTIDFANTSDTPSYCLVFPHQSKRRADKIFQENNAQSHFSSS